MNKQDTERFLERYGKRLDEFGYSPESLGWGGGKERQNLRFEVLSNIGVMENDSILDIGCGFGDLAKFNRANGWSGIYTGVDINEQLLEVGRSQHLDLNLILVDILEEKTSLVADWVMSSGLFNAKLYYQSNETFIADMITRMFSFCRKGVAADFMSTYVDYMHPDGYHTSPSWIIDFVKKELKARCILRMDYLPYEYCVYILK